MSLEGNILKLEQLRRQIAEYGKLPEDVLKRVNYKFRLDWNYYSNSMEGNTLTVQETRSVMINNITLEGKPLKDVLEMRGHDKVITNILQIGQGETRLSEKRIKEIHKAIMYEEDPELQSKIGIWKTEPNYLYNYQNERIDFVPPDEVPEAMHDLMNWLNAALDKIYRLKTITADAVVTAFDFHIRYVTIHPFYDGNGRTARILMNLLLISFGFPPVIIKKGLEEKQYYQYLADVQAYGGSPDLFYELMTNLLIRSQELILNAVQGEEIDEEEDWRKELKLIKQNLGENKVKEIRSPENTVRTIEIFLDLLYEISEEKLKELESLFFEKKILLNNSPFDLYPFIILSPHDRLKIGNPDLLRVSYLLKGYKPKNNLIIDCKSIMIFEFKDYTYSMEFPNSRFKIEKLYGDKYIENEKTQIANEIAKEIIAQIKSKVGEF